MAIEKKTGLFYELMIRGNPDPQNGALGAVMTYMLRTGSAIVDTETNTLAAPYAADPAVDLTKKQAVAFLGEKFGDFVDQLAVERTEKASLSEEIKSGKAALLAASAIIGERDEQLANAVAANDALTARIADLEKQLETTTAARDEFSARIERALATLTAP